MWSLRVGWPLPKDDRRRGRQRPAPVAQIMLLVRRATPSSDERPTVKVTGDERIEFDKRDRRQPLVEP